MKPRLFLILTICALLIDLHAEGQTKKKKKKPKNKLYGSEDAVDGQFPYLVMHIVRMRRSYNTCSGAVVSPLWVLMAAHCTNKNVVPRNHIVVAGKANLSEYARVRFRNIPFQANVNETTFDVQERRASDVFFHPMHTRGGNNDVGLLRLNRPLEFSDRVSAIPIAQEPFQARDDCTLVGYGVLEGNTRKYVLQYIVGMPARPAGMCRHQRNRDVICLADTSRGICPGDSGGPLVCGGVARGVASHGLSNEKGCGRGTIEQYFSDVQKNLVWIDEIMASTVRRRNR